MSQEWGRSSEIEFPKVWLHFSGKTGREYWIQDVTEETKEEFLYYMVNKFTEDEPLDKFSKYPASPEYKREMVEYWTDILREKLSLVCLTKDPVGKTVVAGINGLTRCYKGELDAYEGDTPRTREFISVLKFIKQEGNPYERLGLTEYLSASGMYVDEKYRGDGIGYSLLKARETLCRALGFKATLTVFTSAASQRIAEKSGFQDLYRITYADMARVNAEFRFPGIEEDVESVRYMYKMFL